MHDGHHVSWGGGGRRKGGMGSDGSSSTATLKGAFLTLPLPIHQALSLCSSSHGGEDGSLIAYDLVSSWRYYVPSNPFTVRPGLGHLAMIKVGRMRVIIKQKKSPDLGQYPGGTR